MKKLVNCFLFGAFALGCKPEVENIKTFNGVVNEQFLVPGKGHVYFIGNNKIYKEFRAQDYLFEKGDSVSVNYSNYDVINSYKIFGKSKTY